MGRELWPVVFVSVTAPMLQMRLPSGARHVTGAMPFGWKLSRFCLSGPKGRWPSVSKLSYFPRESRNLNASEISLFFFFNVLFI